MTCAFNSELLFETEQNHFCKQVKCAAEVTMVVTRLKESYPLHSEHSGFGLSAAY